MSKGSFFLYTGITCASLSLFGKAEVANEWFINFASGSEIDLLQDFMIFAGMPSTPVAFFGVRFRDESIYAFRGDGTKIKTSRSRDVCCYFFDAGVI